MMVIAQRARVDGWVDGCVPGKGGREQGEGEDPEGGGGRARSHPLGGRAGQQLWLGRFGRSIGNSHSSLSLRLSCSREREREYITSRE